MAQPLQKMVGQFLKHCVAIPLLGVYSRELKMCVHTETCACKFIVVVFVITKIEPAQMSLSQWMDKQSLVAIHTIKFCSAIKGNKLLTHAATWVDPKSIMLSERSNLKGFYTIWFNLHDILRKKTKARADQWLPKVGVEWGECNKYNIIQRAFEGDGLVYI